MVSDVKLNLNKNDISFYFKNSNENYILGKREEKLNDLNVVHHYHHNEQQSQYISNNGNKEAFIFNTADSESLNWLQTIIDSSHLVTFCISISVIIYASFRSLESNRDDTQSQENEKQTNEENESNERAEINQVIDSKQAVFIPIAASLSLLLMFFFFDSIQNILLICTSVLAIVTFSFLLLPICLILFKTCLPHCPDIINKKVACSFCGYFTLPELLSLFLSSSLVCLWIITGHWLLMDIIGVGFCITFITIVRLPSLKVSTLLLVGLVIYDVFWVYFSHLIFNSNVMVKVATKEADNPINFVAKRLNMETEFSKDSPKLSLPGKLVVPSYQRSGNFSILGLGDIVIPGLLLCFVLRFDAYKRNQIYQELIDTSESTSNEKQDESNKKNSYSITNSNEIKPTLCFKQPHKINCYCCECNPKHNNYFLFRHKSVPLISRSNPYLDPNKTRFLNRQYSNAYLFKHFIYLNKLSYFRISLIGYFIGLITATLSSEIFREAQPALLFLVPFTLIPLLLMAYLKGDLHMMWNEPFTYSAPKYFYV